MAAGEHLGERGHVGGGGLQVRAGSQYLLEMELFVGIEVFGAAQYPGGDLADLGHHWCGRWCGSQCPEGCQIGGDGTPAALVALVGDLPVQGGGVGDAGIPALVQVGLVGIQHTGPARAGRGQQFLDVAGAVEAPDGLFGQFQFPHDGLDALTIGFQSLDGLVAGLGTDDQGGVLGA
ncbi:MAG: hypothetical protein QOJ73_2475 [Streptosporangiaceae bacterium]|nr:hypothetical protein [Streptosporangiaceae bacterium]